MGIIDYRYIDYSRNFIKIKDGVNKGDSEKCFTNHESLMVCPDSEPGVFG